MGSILGGNLSLTASFSPPEGRQFLPNSGGQNLQSDSDAPQKWNPFCNRMYPLLGTTTTFSWWAQGAQCRPAFAAVRSHSGSSEVTNLNCGLNYGLLLSNDLSLVEVFSAN